MRSTRTTHAKGHRAKEKQRDNSKEFHTYYTQVYGSRWPALQEALLKPTVNVAVVNGLLPGGSASVNSPALTALLSIGALTVLKRAKTSGAYDPPPLDPASGLRLYYWMDLASVLPVLLLQARKGHTVLDMCSAPGGKSMLIAQRLFGAGSELPEGVEAVGGAGAGAGVHTEASSSTTTTTAAATEAAAPAAPACPSPSPAPPLPAGPGKLVCNEPDRQRLQRLNRVLEEYLPAPCRVNLEVHNYHGHMYWGRNQGGRYDRVLVDAPCSSDRHVLQQAAGAVRGAISTNEWSLMGCRRIADEQLQLCLAAVRALRVGGRLVYSTCSIAPIQNDQVIQRLLDRYPGGGLRVVPALEVLHAEAAASGASTAASAAAAAAASGAGEGGAGGASGAQGAGCASGAGVGACLAALGAEATQLGAICLPDRRGWGPIYVAVVEKTGELAGTGGVGVQLSGAVQRMRELELEEVSDSDEEGGEGQGEPGQGGAGAGGEAAEAEAEAEGAGGEAEAGAAQAAEAGAQG